MGIISGAWSAVDKFLGGTGGQPVDSGATGVQTGVQSFAPSTDEYASESAIARGEMIQQEAAGFAPTTDEYAAESAIAAGGPIYTREPLLNEEGYIVGTPSGVPTVPGWYSAGPHEKPVEGYGIDHKFVEAGKETPKEFFPLGNVVSTSRELSEAEQRQVLENLQKSGIKGGWWDEPQRELVKYGGGKATKDVTKNILELPGELSVGSETVAEARMPMAGVVESESIGEGTVTIGKLPEGHQSYIHSVSGTGDESLGGFKLFGIINAGDINTPGSALWNAQHGVTARRSRRSIPKTKRKKLLAKISPQLPSVKKTSPKILYPDTLNKQIMPKSLGSDLFKFKIGAPDALVKSIGARTNLKAKTTIDNYATGLKIPDIGITMTKGQSNMMNNINDIVKNVTGSVKKVKPRKK